MEMIIKKYAAIDIGSNAVRLLITMMTKMGDAKPSYKKMSLVRVPIRLGEDVFSEGRISEEKRNRLSDTMKAFKLLMKSHKVERYKACATSAMRDAENGGDVVQTIKKETGVDIEIIDGDQEATYITSSDLRDILKTNKTYLYVDVGGGSTEFTIYSKGKQIASKSFNLGTIRLLNKKVDEHLWEEARIWLEKETKPFNTLQMIGSGGNINYIFKQSGKKIDKPIGYFYLKSFYEKIAQLSYEERICKLSMKPDRADVIISATQIYLFAMKHGGTRWLIVPKIGLADGITKSLSMADLESL